MFGESAGFGVEERAGLGVAVEHEDFDRVGGGGGGGGGGAGASHCGVGRFEGRGS